AVVIEEAGIAAREPLVLDRLRRRVGLVPVALHNMRALDLDLADVADWYEIALAIDDADFAAKQRNTAGAEFAFRRIVRFRRKMRAPARGLRQAVKLDEIAAHHLLRPQQHIVGDRRRAIGDRLQSRE